MTRIRQIEATAAEVELKVHSVTSGSKRKFRIYSDLSLSENYFDTRGLLASTTGYSETKMWLDGYRTAYYNLTEV
jgi:hypothetical protein